MINVDAVKLDGTVVVSFNLKLDDQIEDVERRIRKKMALEEGEFRLVHRGIILYGPKTVEECGFVRDNIVGILLPLRGGTKIFIKKIEGEEISIEVLIKDKIIDLKKLIKEKLTIEPEKQRLVFEGVVLEDNKTMEEYKFKENSVINIVDLTNFQIFAKTMDGQTIALLVKKTDTIIEVKLKFQEKKGIVPEEQKIVFIGVIMEDDKTVEFYHIEENNVINVVSRLRGGHRAREVSRGVVHKQHIISAEIPGSL